MNPTSVTGNMVARGPNKVVGTKVDTGGGETGASASPIIPAHKLSTQPDECKPRDHFLGSGPDIQYLTIATGTIALADVPVLLTMQARFIMCVAANDANVNDTLYMHFLPLNKSYTTTAIVRTGAENWLPFSNNPVGDNKIGVFFLFKRPMPRTIYFDIGHEAGGAAGLITFAIGNDIDQLGNMLLG